jgi:hypothetical protein
LRARERATSGGIVLVCGSLYLVGEVIAPYKDRGARKGARVAPAQASADAARSTRVTG